MNKNDLIFNVKTRDAWTYFCKSHSDGIQSFDPILPIEDEELNDCLNSAILKLDEMESIKIAFYSRSRPLEYPKDPILISEYLRNLKALKLLNVEERQSVKLMVNLHKSDTPFHFNSEEIILSDVTHKAWLEFANFRRGARIPRLKPIIHVEDEEIDKEIEERDREYENSGSGGTYETLDVFDRDMVHRTGADPSIFKREPDPHLRSYLGYLQSLKSMSMQERKTVSIMLSLESK